LIFSGARRKEKGSREKLMLKESEVGKRRLKQPCGRVELQMRRKLREGRGIYEYQINDRNAVFYRPRGKLIRGYFVVYEFSKLPCFKETRHYLHCFDWCKKVPCIILRFTLSSKTEKLGSPK